MMLLSSLKKYDFAFVEHLLKMRQKSKELFCISLFSNSIQKNLETLDADKVIIYAKIANTFLITTTIDSLDRLNSMKDNLKRNIQPEIQRIFIPTNKIEIYKDGKVQGTILISGSKEEPFANFVSDKLDFGFKLTYGIGMSL